MEADDFLCSRNARPPKALVGRAQWKTNQPPFPKSEGVNGTSGKNVVRWPQSESPHCPARDGRGGGEVSARCEQFEGQSGSSLEGKAGKIGRPSPGLMARSGKSIVSC